MHDVSDGNLEDGRWKRQPSTVCFTPLGNGDSADSGRVSRLRETQQTQGDSAESGRRSRIRKTQGESAESGRLRESQLTQGDSADSGRLSRQSESPTMTITWHTSKYKRRFKLHQGHTVSSTAYILPKWTFRFSSALSIEDCIQVVEKAHMRSTLPLSEVPFRLCLCNGWRNRGMGVAWTTSDATVLTMVGNAGNGESVFTVGELCGTLFCQCVCMCVCVCVCFTKKADFLPVPLRACRRHSAF